MSTASYWPVGTITGRMNKPHMPRMQNIPRPKPTLEERILKALDDDSQKTFGQLSMACTSPADVINTNTIHDFDDKLDEELRKLIAVGKVILVARRPELIFRRGTILDQILKATEPDEQA